MFGHRFPRTVAYLKSENRDAFVRKLDSGILKFQRYLRITVAETVANCHRLTHL